MFKKIIDDYKAEHFSRKEWLAYNLIAVLLVICSLIGGIIE